MIKKFVRFSAKKKLVGSQHDAITFRKRNLLLADEEFKRTGARRHRHRKTVYQKQTFRQTDRKHEKSIRITSSETAAVVTHD